MANMPKPTTRVAREEEHDKARRRNARVNAVENREWSLVNKHAPDAVLDDDREHRDRGGVATKDIVERVADAPNLLLLDVDDTTVARPADSVPRRAGLKHFVDDRTGDINVLHKKLGRVVSKNFVNAEDGDAVIIGGGDEGRASAEHDTKVPI